MAGNENNRRRRNRMVRGMGALAEFWMGRRVPLTPPMRLWVDITSRCNLNCVHCVRPLLPPDQSRDMDDEVLAALVSEAGWLGVELSLFHRGEPLVHPEFSLWARRFKEAGCKIRVHTNATLLDRERVAQILWAQPDDIVCSVDTLEPGAYAAGRRGAALPKTLEGIERLLASRKALGMDLPRVRILTMGPEKPAREGELERLFTLGLNGHDHRVPHNWGGMLDYPEAGEPEGREKPSRCSFLWQALTVLSDGRVSPCPQDFAGKIELGRIGPQSLMDIWRGEPMQKLREAHVKGRLDEYPVCESCDRIRRPTILRLPSEYLKNFLRTSILSGS